MTAPLGSAAPSTMAEPAALRAWDAHGDGSVLVVDIGLACCTLEFEARAAQRTEAWAPSVWPPTVAPALVVAVVSGTVTDRLAPAVLGLVDACRAVGPTAVVAFGACASSGGPYWDSYAVTKGIDQFVEVDAFVAGCPPTPDALDDAVHRLAEADRG